MELTKELFLSGVEFQQKNDFYARYQYKTSLDGGYVVEITGKRFLRIEHDCNIDIINKNRFRVYTTIIGKTVRVWRHFNDYIVISKDKQPA